ncbi:MAG: sugar phosphate isomerase/epimerase [Planctomycetes bacterium]|nr:sugar phosphate isomerase/epimerase [Planctomycetota bacterium]
MVSPDRDRESQLDRRAFLAQGMLAGAALSLPAVLAEGAFAAVLDEKKAGGSDPYGGFKMGIQSYSLRHFEFRKMVDILSGDLSIKWVELYPGHFPMEAEESDYRMRRRHMRQGGVTPAAYGVVPFKKDAGANRKVFEFAKRMGLLSISADPDPDSFDSLDKLLEEFKIPVAIHNHGPGSRYDKIEVIDKAIKDHHKLIGLCVDTGHFLRSEVDPVEVVKHFKERVYGVHLKDVKNLEGGKKKFTVLGEGDLKTVELLKALREAKFNGCMALEYEEEEQSPVASIKRCLESMKESVKKTSDSH